MNVHILSKVRQNKRWSILRSSMYEICQALTLFFENANNASYQYENVLVYITSDPLRTTAIGCTMQHS